MVSSLKNSKSTRKIQKVEENFGKYRWEKI